MDASYYAIADWCWLGMIGVLMIVAAKIGGKADLLPVGRRPQSIRNRPNQGLIMREARMGDEKDEPAVEEVKDPTPVEEVKADDAEHKDEALNEKKDAPTEDESAA